MSKVTEILDKATKEELQKAQEEVIRENGLKAIEDDVYYLDRSGQEWTKEDLATAMAEVLKQRK